jgi:hypothetical protein
MSQPPPPPPPPHGEMPKSSSGLPPGKYDIFVIPQHSAGSGFLYLPSLQPNVNSFAAGFASALMLVAMFQSMAPAFQAWWSSFQGMGNMGMTMLVVAVGVGAWAFGRTQNDNPGGNHGGSGGSNGGHSGGGNFGGTNTGPNTGTTPDPGPPPPPPPPPHNNGPPPSSSQNERSKPSWQRPPPQPGTTRADTAKGSWERAREETRRKEEERKAKEEEQKRRDETARRLRELREKEAREREQREKEARERREKLERDKKEKELKDLLEKERSERERLQKEKEEREAREAREAQLAKEAKEREEKRKKEEEAAKAAAKGSTYAFSGVGEKINPWPNGKPPPPTSAATPTKPAPSTASTSAPNTRPPAPTARTYLGTEEETYSYRPYDQQKRPARKKSTSSFVSESSWAPSQSTARTTPPPSFRGPYTTKDPDKIVIKAVYLFMNQFAKTPASQLVSGVGSVTDGLILRITTEGLFIDDDVRGVPQREWDVKAWTLKLVEVWCPPHGLNSSSTPASNNSPNLLHKMAGQRVRAADRGGTKPLTGDEADVYLTEMLRACKDCCRLGLCETTFKNTNIPSSTGQTGEWTAKGLHVLRATIRDQEGKKYLFVLGEEESWKVSVGLQRLRRGTLASRVGVSGISASDARGTLEMLGWRE